MTVRKHGALGIFLWMRSERLYTVADAGAPSRSSCRARRLRCRCGRHGAPDARLRPRPAQRAHRRWDRRAVVPGGRRRRRRSDRGDREPRRRPVARAAGRLGTGGGAGFHRHARPIGVQPARRRARREQADAGRHDRADRRGKLGRPDQRPDDRGRRDAVRALSPDGRLAHARRVPHAPERSGPARHQSRVVRRRRRRPQLRARPRRPGRDAHGARRDEAGGRLRDGGRRLWLELVAAVRSRSVRLDRGARRAGPRRGGARRHLHHAPAIRERPDLRVARRSLHHRRAGEDSGRDLPSEDGLPGELGPDARRARPDTRRPRARPGRHGGSVPLHPRRERPRRVPAPLGARGEQGADDGAPEGPGASRPHQAGHGRPQRHVLGEPVVRIGRRRRRPADRRHQSGSAPVPKG